VFEPIGRPVRVPWSEGVEAQAATEGTAILGTPTFAGNEVIVPLTGVTNQQYVTVSAGDVVATDSGTGGPLATPGGGRGASTVRQQVLGAQPASNPRDPESSARAPCLTVDVRDRSLPAAGPRVSC